MDEIKLDHVFITAGFCALIGVGLIKQMFVQMNYIDALAVTLAWYMAFLHANKTGIFQEVL
jgi:hypothetical protein